MDFFYAVCISSIFVKNQISIGVIFCVCLQSNGVIIVNKTGFNYIKMRSLIVKSLFQRGLIQKVLVHEQVLEYVESLLLRNYILKLFFITFLLLTV